MHSCAARLPFMSRAPAGYKQQKTSADLSTEVH